MAGDAAAFSHAVQNFVSGKGKDKKKDVIIYTELIKAGNNLATAAVRAPDSELDIAATAVSLTEDSQIAWISECDRAGLRRGGWWASLLRRLRAAISGPEPTLPAHRRHVERQAKLVDKRQVLFGIALGAPVGLLVSAVATNIFPSEYAPWIGGTTVLVWIGVSAGMVANQYGKTNLELQAASHLSRLGMMGLSVLLGIYAYWAFFPFSKCLFWAFVVIPLAFHGCLWIVSCIRGDDNSVKTDGIVL